MLEVCIESNGFICEKQLSLTGEQRGGVSSQIRSAGFVSALQKLYAPLVKQSQPFQFLQFYSFRMIWFPNILSNCIPSHNYCNQSQFYFPSCQQSWDPVIIFGKPFLPMAILKLPPLARLAKPNARLYITNSKRGDDQLALINAERQLTFDQFDMYYKKYIGVLDFKLLYSIKRWITGLWLWWLPDHNGYSMNLEA